LKCQTEFCVSERRTLPLCLICPDTASLPSRCNHAGILNCSCA
jgi:hypothetical protein